MTSPGHDLSDLLLHAYVDGELDAASAIAFEKRLAAEPGLAAARDRLLGLRRVLRQEPRETAPEGLRRSMAAFAAAPPDRAPPPASKPRVFGRAIRPIRSEWSMALAACLVGVLSGAVLTQLVLDRAPPPSPVMAEVVADHLRAVMAPEPFDVASSDQHTVKPWFTGRLPFAPQVFDLAQAGFPLVGGRVDVLSGQPAASLVFRHGKHLISLTSQPATAVGPSGRRAEDGRGFLVREWETGGMHYWAVSDIAPNELDAFEQAARAQLAGAG